MMIAWKNYSTIIRIRVADAGEAGDEFVGLGGTLAGGDGRYQIDTADEKIVENIGGTQQSPMALPLLLVAVSTFSQFKLWYIQIYSNVGATVSMTTHNTTSRATKGKATIRHNFYLLSE